MYIATNAKMTLLEKNNFKILKDELLPNNLCIWNTCIMFPNSDKSNPTKHIMPIIYNNFKSNLFWLSSVLFLSLIRCNEIQNVLSDYVIH